MMCDFKVASPPEKSLVIFDGDCNFCTLWIRRWEQMTGDAVDYLPSQDARIAAQFPEIPRDRFQTAVQLIETDGTVVSGAEAVFRLLAKNRGWRWALTAYENASFLARIADSAYSFVAGHRTIFSRLTRWFWGCHVGRPDYRFTSWIYLRTLGLIYLAAFISLWLQVSGLIGHNGILPADQFMSAAQQQCDAQHIGLERFYLLPTLCWLDSSNGFLNFQCAAGTICAILLIVDLVPAPVLALLWLLYLSLATVGRDFLSFQWDNLLLEAGFVSIFLAPWQLLSTTSSPPSRIVVWLLRLLLFKLMFSSGCVKLLSGDPNWRNLTALTFHYQTQPLPTWMGWYANQLPLWFQKCSCVIMFVVELAAPFLIFAPRRLRLAGGALIAGLQILILLTGNYAFFNFLTIALCLLLLDDFVMVKWLRRLRFDENKAGKRAGASGRCRWPRLVTVPLAAVVVVVSLFQVTSMFGLRSGILLPAAFLDAQLAPLRVINNYGLFAVMTTRRNEIIVEGSDDGTTWRTYEFKFKPGDVNRRPGFIEPFQPRLDWQMWFAALGDYRQNPWFLNFCARLLQGAPEVSRLLANNPFPDRPPRLVRARLYEYHFTTFQERARSGAWWKCEPAGDYLPVISLADLQKS